MSKLENAQTRYVETVKAIFPEAFSTWVESADGISYYAVFPYCREHDCNPALGKGITLFLAWQNAAKIPALELTGAY